MTVALNARPRTLEAVARESQAGSPFDPLLREFLDEFYVADREQRQAAIGSEPPRLAPVHDAYLAAVAEHLALRFGLAIPDWTESEASLSRKPFFAGGLEGLKALLLVEVRWRSAAVRFSSAATRSPVPAMPTAR